MMPRLRIDRIDIYSLSIPFQFSFNHATAARSASDSLIWVVRAGETVGVGEAVSRDYVSGAREHDTPLEAADADTRWLIDEMLGRSVSLQALHNLSQDDTCDTFSSFVRNRDSAARCAMFYRRKRYL